MTVAAFIKALQKEDPKAIVVLSKDSEGNGYSPLYQIGRSIYANGEIYEEDDEVEGGKRAVVLWP
jgi:hypothetical protein